MKTLSCLILKQDMYQILQIKKIISKSTKQPSSSNKLLAYNYFPCQVVSHNKTRWKNSSDR